MFVLTWKHCCGCAGSTCGEDAMFGFCVFCLRRNYMNDSLRTNVFVRFQVETIACACIFLAARALQVAPRFTLWCRDRVVSMDFVMLRWSHSSDASGSDSDMFNITLFQKSGYFCVLFFWPPPLAKQVAFVARGRVESVAWFSPFVPHPWFAQDMATHFLF